jgi:uncharacterized membrane protein YhaH (DUF805 family)
MGWLFSFDGRIRRAAYAAASVGTFFLTHLIILAVCLATAEHISVNALFLFAPWRWVLTNKLWPFNTAPSAWLLIGGLAMTVLTSWVLAALAMRRASDARVSGWLAALTIAPVLQVPAILVLALLPSRAHVESSVSSREALTMGQRWKASLQGLLAAVALILFTVAVGALLFGSYGFSMFVVSPAVIGITTAYLANLQGDLGVGRTVCIVTAALAAGGLALVGLAFEGILCIVMAAPVAWAMAVLGAEIGRAMARARRNRGSHALISVAIIPLLFTSEEGLPPTTTFADVMSIEVTATPTAAWRAVVHMDRIAVPPPVPFRLGIAYPISSDVIGEGVGAERVGYFSTGIAHELVTEWEPGRTLGFVILSEPPSLRELSPYQNVHAPHVDGYFRSTSARIDIDRIAQGRMRLTLTTSHELDLQPAAYWLALARWIIRQNKERTLLQMQRQAEQDPAQ